MLSLTSKYSWNEHDKTTSNNEHETNSGRKFYQVSFLQVDTHLEEVQVKLQCDKVDNMENIS